MSLDPGGSRVVMIVSAPGEAREIRAAIEDRTGYETVRVAPVDAGDRLDSTDSFVACVAVIGGFDGSALDCIETLRDRDPDLPIVARLPAAGVELAEEVTRAGATDVVLRGEDSALIERIEAGVERYERRWRNAEMRSVLETVLTDLDVPIYVKDEEARHRLLSEIEGGPKPEEVLGKTDVEVYRDVDEAFARETYQDDLKVIETGEPIRDKVERHGTGTATHWSQTTKVPWRDDGEIRGLVGVSKDITELKLRERQLERQNERLDRFASYIAHDLRNPLNIAQGHLDFVRDGDESAIDRVEASLARMEELLDDVQALVRGRSDPSATPRSVDFAGLLRDVWQVIETESATLEVSLPEGTRISASEAQLRPMIENLLRNAIVHVGPDVTVRVGVLEDGFYVEDDGPGIPEEAREDVFQEGYTTAEEGTGTGLAIVAETVDAHRWDLEVTESVEGGARFEIRNCMIVTHPELGEESGESVHLSRNVDVGDVEKAGEASRDPETGTWTVRGAGFDVWQDIDEFHFVYAPVSGETRITTRIATVDGPNEYSKAGVMLRDDIGPGAPFGYVGTTPEHGTEVLWRREPGDSIRSQQLEEGGVHHDWFRLDRADGRLTCSVSTDGEEWVPIDQRSVTLGDEVVVGLVVSSVVPQQYCTATFEETSVVELGRCE